MIDIALALHKLNSFVIQQTSANLRQIDYCGARKQEARVFDWSLGKFTRIFGCEYF